MSSLRLVLILLLTLALDLSTPIPPLHGASEAAEEVEESLHGQAARRPVREIVVKAAVAHERRVGESFRPRRITTARPRRATVTIRKLPPSFAEPASPSDDH